MGTNIILGQLLTLGILILTGFIFAKFRVISLAMKEALARVIIDITLPFLILSTFSRMQLGHNLLINGGGVIILTFTSLAILHVLGILTARLLRLSPDQAVIHSLHTMLGNVVFLGFPILDALFPNGLGVFYGAFYQLVSSAVTYTYAITRLSSGGQKPSLKKLINLNTGALLLGILIMAFGIRLPNALGTPIALIGKCTSPLSMLYIGSLLAEMNFKQIFSKWSVYALAINKLVLGPMLLALIYLLLLPALGLNLPHEALIVVVLEAAMPCQTIVVVMSRRFGIGDKLATANLFITTLLSIATLPLLYKFVCWLMYT